MKTYINENKTTLKQLEMFIPIVYRVHGNAHPEFEKVKNNFNIIIDNLKKGDFNLDREFNDLRKITNNYQVPNDVCESYEAVYEMLSKLDASYHRK